MQAIWRVGDERLTARDVESALFALDGKERNIASLMTVLAKLVDKGYLNPVKEFRKSTYYLPIISEREYKAFVTKQFINGIHDGDLASVVSAFVDGGECTEFDLERLRDMIKQMSESN